MDTKRFERAETVFQWKGLVMCQLVGASERQIEYAQTFLRVPPPAKHLLAIKQRKAA
jgi:hypothetical protein